MPESLQAARVSAAATATAPVARDFFLTSTFLSVVYAHRQAPRWRYRKHPLTGEAANPVPLRAPRRDADHCGRRRCRPAGEPVHLVRIRAWQLHPVAARTIL
ncbi:hypothetical protein RHRU231_850031 [Rhodococcus ruber]|uniref:Uncharacterized protein n=1 Tax=Rhodococcus ruber TaxID=1830 RepID=A0A098BV19_9NOCA|nr:hypothetical protein RHRU231_850031 [Rhodococcus ruber]